MTQSKSTSDDVTTDVDLADTFISRKINDDNVSDVTNDDFSAKAQIFSRSDLIREQNSDPDVSCLFARSVDESDVSRDPVCFYTKNDVLMRKWRPSDVPADGEWAVKHQIVVPRCYRPQILSLAHDTPMSGQSGLEIGMKVFIYCCLQLRESVQESLGFSPFELLFGHSVRGPLKLFKEKLLLHDDVSLNLLQYVSDFRTNFSNACVMAKSNLKISRTFKPGERVLALLPVPERPL